MPEAKYHRIELPCCGYRTTGVLDVPITKITLSNEFFILFYSSAVNDTLTVVVVDDGNASIVFLIMIGVSSVVATVTFVAPPIEPVPSGKT